MFKETELSQSLYECDQKEYSNITFHAVINLRYLYLILQNTMKFQGRFNKNQKLTTKKDSICDKTLRYKLVDGMLLLISKVKFSSTSEMFEDV
jgi:hypothetical protein